MHFLPNDARLAIMVEVSVLLPSDREVEMLGCGNASLGTSQRCGHLRCKELSLVQAFVEHKINPIRVMKKKKRQKTNKSISVDWHHLRGAKAMMKAKSPSNKHSRRQLLSPWSLVFHPAPAPSCSFHHFTPRKLNCLLGRAPEESAFSRYIRSWPLTSTKRYLYSYSD